MKFADNRGMTDPALNLALEEYILRTLPDGERVLLFYINEPSIIIGKNQNTAEEINSEFVSANNLHVVRRLSGGGAVYHDLGNLNFSFIMQDDGSSFHNFSKFTEPVVRALHKMGVEAALSGRNDLQVGERKISGNAQFFSKGRMFSHGTLLFDSEIEQVVSALKVNAEKYVSKATKSIRSRVANISEFLPEPMDIASFRERLLQEIFEDEAEIPLYKLSDEDWAAVEQLAKERYSDWSWNYGRSPKFNVQQKKRIEGVGTFDVRLLVEEGRIVEAAIFGDYFGRGDRQEVEAALCGVRYDRQSLMEAAERLDLSYYFGALTTEAWLELLI